MEATEKLSAIDEKWEQVKFFYGHSYKIGFKHRPSNDRIEWLYFQMRKLGQELGFFYQNRPPKLENNVIEIKPET